MALPAPTPAPYGKLTQALHWATAVLVLIAFIYGPGGSETKVYSAARDFDRQLHETLGLCVLALLVLRVLWRFVDERPAPSAMPRWMHVASKSAQGVLYLLLIVVPATAIAGAWLEGHPLTLLGGLSLGPFVAKSHDTGAFVANAHGWLGDTILWLAGFHALAALYHHFILKDPVLETMLPHWLRLRR